MTLTDTGRMIYMTTEKEWMPGFEPRNFPGLLSAIFSVEKMTAGMCLPVSDTAAELIEANTERMLRRIKAMHIMIY